MSKKNRKRKLDGEDQLMVDWEQENIFPEEIRNEIGTMWEIPQIFHFLHLTKEALNIPHLSMYEMERMLLIPRASKQLANIMTSLLSSPVTKAKLRKIPPMPYEFWTNILAYKMKSWFKIYEAKHQDAVKVLESIGVEPEFWNVFPDAPLLNGKDFEDLTFKQKVWLVKTVCDTVMHTRKTVQEEMAKQTWEDQFETVLGTDRYGARYIYFPQFLKSDLRVYRHCLDNKILSTVKPIKPKIRAEPTSKVLGEDDLLRKKAKYRRKKSRLSNGVMLTKSEKTNKYDEKHLNDCKCSSDSATGSLINEDTNFSGTSVCSNNNNNNSNNNNISVDTINVKRSRSLSKCSEVSTETDITHCKSTKSSGYDTNSSTDAISSKRSSQKMFKGFSNSSCNNISNIEIISGILSDLKSATSEERSAENIDISLSSQNKLDLNAAKQQYLGTMGLCLNKNNSVNRTIDNLCSTSKTDDEKLNEIISAENSKLNDKSSDNVVHKETHNQMSIVSKSDDEKLNETRTAHKQEDNASFPKEKKGNKVSRRNGKFVKDEKSDKESEKSNKRNTANEMESSDDKGISLNELRSLLQKEAMEDDFSFDEDSEVKYNLRKLKNTKIDGWKQEIEDFNEMLLELSKSKFELVADSVSSLRDLISTFSQSTSPNADTDGETEPIPPCEVKLVIKLKELLSSLEEIEPALRDSMKKARGKLQKEWANFKEGAVLCQLPETQRYKRYRSLPYPQLVPKAPAAKTKKKVLPTQNTVRTSTRNARNLNIKSHKMKQKEESLKKVTETVKKPREPKKKRKKTRVNKNKNPEECYAQGESPHTQSNCTQMMRSRRTSWRNGPTLRQYTRLPIHRPVHPLLTLVRKSNTLTIGQTRRTQTKIGYYQALAKGKINVRVAATRRLKSFQHKLQSIKVDALQDAAESKVVSPSTETSEKETPKIKEIQPRKLKKPSTSEASDNNSTIENQEALVEHDPNKIVPSTEVNCKIENVASVHSELDIKDEGPIYDSVPNQYNNYATTFNPNYVMFKADPNPPMNYYVMQPNSAAVVPQTTIMQSGPVVSNVISQGYYMQGGQNYIIQNPQSSFVPSQPFQPQGPQMIAPQQFVNHPSYVPYMVTATQPGYVTTNQQMAPQGAPQNSLFATNAPNSTPARSPRTKYPLLRQNHLNGAVIRSSPPVRGNIPRASNPKVTKNVQQQRNTPVKMQSSRKPSIPSDNTGQKITSLIVLSDSDDEIEMIITEKTSPETETEKSTSRKSSVQARQKPTVTSHVTVSPTKGTIPPQIIQRMNQGGISITPVKATPPAQNGGTQLVVVVNETGSHYALALPNGSKLILTPEQVAQIRASNGGKLIL